MKQSLDYFLVNPEYARHRAFWQRQFDETSEVFQLSSAILCGRDVDASNTATEIEVPLSNAALAVVWTLSRQSDTGIFAIIAAALSLLLSRYVGNDKVAIELPTVVSISDERALLGETYPLVVSLHNIPTVKDLLLLLSRSIPGCQSHQYFPVSAFCAHVGIDVGSDVFLASHSLHPDSYPDKHHNLALVVHGNEMISLRLSSPSRRFPAWFLGEMAFHLTELLALFADVERSITCVQEVIQRRLMDKLSDFNQTDKIFANTRAEASHPESAARRSTVIDLFERQVQLHPLEAALVCGDESLSYGMLDELATRLAAHIVERFAIKPGQVVASLSTRSHWAVVTLLAVLKTGATFLPLNPKLPVQAMTRILEESQSCVLMTHSSELARAMEIAEIPVYAADLQLPGADMAFSTLHFPSVQCDGDDLAYIIYTSGTTGVPKGVMVPHAGLANTTLEHIERFSVTTADRYLQFMAISFDGFLLDTFTTLCAGAALVIADERTIEDPARFMDTVEEYKITLSTITPSYLQLLDPARLSRLRLLVSAGEVISPALAEQYAGRLALYNGYGPSEAAINSTLHRIDPLSDLTLIPIGRPGANKQIYVVDACLALQPIGVIGEICIAGQGLARGYVGDSALTAEKFIQSPFHENARLYRTGDFGAWTPEGDLLFKGRSDSQIKINGLRVDLNEIDRALQACGDVAATHVLTQKSRIGRSEIVAFYQCSTKMELVPSLGEYDVYDVFLYDSMANDHVRVEGYKRVLADRVRDKVVMDPGTGAELILARHCIAAGAKRVYAIEIDDAAFQAASQNIRHYGLENRIVLIKGDVATIGALPEPIDYVVSALAGNIGSADGCIPIVQKIKKRMPEEVSFIPNRYVTRIAGFELAEDKMEWGFSEISAHYIDVLFKKYKKPFDFRLCIQNMAHQCLLTDAQTAEDVRYAEDLQAENQAELVLPVSRAGCLTGFALWLNAFCDEELMIDSSRKTHHLPVYLPLQSTELLDVVPGEQIHIVFSRTVGADDFHPDYRIDGFIRGTDGTERPLHCWSPSDNSRFQSHALYRRLLSPDGKPTTFPKMTTANLRSCLAAQLPQYMVPHRLVEVKEWPLTSHGKTDAVALANLPASTDRQGEEYVPSSTALEAALCKVWGEVLELERIGITDNFFSLGGDSIRVIQAAHKAREGGLGMDASDLMAHPTIQGLAAFLASAETDGATAFADAMPMNAIKIPFDLIKLTKEEIDALPERTQDAYPATEMQLLMLDAYENDIRHDGIYHCCAVWHIEDNTLSEDTLVAALQHLYDTQRSLRTAFLKAPSGRCLQVICVSHVLDVMRHDMRAAPGTLDNAYFREKIAADIADRYELFTGKPLVRLRLWRTTDTSCALLISFHHAILDGWSGAELRNLLVEHYLALKSNIPFTITQSTHDAKKEFAALECAVLGDSKERQYWEALLGAPDVGRSLSICAAVKSANTQTGFATYEAALSCNLGRRANEIAQALSVTLKAVFLNSALQALRAMLNTSQLAMGVVMNGRSEQLSDPLRSTGLFWNIVPFVVNGKIPLSPATVQAQLNDIQPMSHFPLREMERRLLGGAASIPSFNFVNFHNERAHATAKLEEGVVNDRFHFPLNIFVATKMTDQGISGIWRVEYDREKFDAGQIASLIQCCNNKILSDTQMEGEYQ